MDNRTLAQKMRDRYSDKSITDGERAITKAWLIKNNAFDINSGHESTRRRQPAQEYDWGDPVKPKTQTTTDPQAAQRAQYFAANKARRIIHDQVRVRLRNEYTNYQQQPKTVEVNTTTTTTEGGGMCLLIVIMVGLFTLKYIIYG
jgi:hypothetical protein